MNLRYKNQTNGLCLLAVVKWSMLRSFKPRSFSVKFQSVSELKISASLLLQMRALFA